MKKLLLFILFAAAAAAQQRLPVSSLQPDCMVTFNFTAASSGAQAAGTVTAGSTGTTSVIDNRTDAGCLDWLVTYSTTTGISALSLLFQTATNVNGVPGTWSAYGGTLSSGINPNTAATPPWAITDATGSKYPFLRMNLTALTGAGTVSGNLYGWKRRPAYVSVIAGTTCPLGTPCVVVGNKSNNAVVPGSTNLGVLPALANAAAPTWTEGFQVVESVDLSGNQRTLAQGFAASGAAKSGKPVQIGGVFNTTQPTVTNGQMVEAQSTARGAIIVAPGVDPFTVTACPTGTPCVVQGPAADGAAVAGNPVRIGGKDGSGNTQDVLTNTAGNIDPAGAATAQADGASNTPNVPSASGAASFQPNYPYKFNGSTWDRDFNCTNQVQTRLTNSTRTQLVALSGSTIIRVCHIHLSTTAPEDITISYGTGSACASGTTTIDSFLSTQSFAMDFQPTAALRTIAANALCITQTGTQNADVTVIYAQF